MIFKCPRLLQVLTMGDAFSLEQRLQLGEGAALQVNKEIKTIIIIIISLFVRKSWRSLSSTSCCLCCYWSAAGERWQIFLRQFFCWFVFIFVVRTFRSCEGLMLSTSSTCSSELSRAASTRRSTAIKITPHHPTTDRTTTLPTASR